MPEVTLGLLTAGGSTDPKEEWSQNGRKYLNDGLNSALSVRKYSLASVDLSTYEDPRALQILKLNDTVSDTIAFNAFPGLALPTKTSFDWTLGDGASSLVPANSTTAPAYALFVRAKGTYSSGGRAAMMIGMAALGVGMPMGGQVITGSLVDLKTGQIVWYQTMGVPSGTDIRTPEGAGEAVNILFKKLPL